MGRVPELKMPKWMNPANVGVVLMYASPCRLLPSPTEFREDPKMGILRAEKLRLLLTS